MLSVRDPARFEWWALLLWGLTMAGFVLWLVVYAVLEFRPAA
ncbi:MAG TPA: hypothetical protein VM364_21255 [Vicinamibacterales bacterium]|nr:hypothetical protein [Vicinamibacterales bacterium]